MDRPRVRVIDRNGDQLKVDRATLGKIELATSEPSIAGRADAAGAPVASDGTVAEFIRGLPAGELAGEQTKPATAGELAAEAIRQTCAVTAERVRAAASEQLAAAVENQREAEEFAAELVNLGELQAQRIELFAGALKGTADTMKAERARIAEFARPREEGQE